VLGFGVSCLTFLCNGLRLFYGLGFKVFELELKVLVLGFKVSSLTFLCNGLRFFL
jgi:hypothetical protein